MRPTTVEASELALASEVREIMAEGDALGMKRPTQERAKEIARLNLEAYAAAALEAGCRP